MSPSPKQEFLTQIIGSKVADAYWEDDKLILVFISMTDSTASPVLAEFHVSTPIRKSSIRRQIPS